MHARVEDRPERVWLERVLAGVAALWLMYVLVNYGPRDLASLGFPLSIGLGVWVPCLARWTSSAVGDVRCAADGLVVPRRWSARRIPWSQIQGVSVAPAARGASLLVRLRNGDLVAIAAEHVEDVERVAREMLSLAPAIELVMVPVRRLRWVAAALRPITSLLALAYYLHVGLGVIGGDKGTYGLGALFAGIVLFVIHMVGSRDISLGDAAAKRAYPRALRAHFDLHARAAGAADRARAPRPRVSEHGQTPAEWLRRMRVEGDSLGPYRDVAQGKQAQLEQTLRSSEAPLRERALALRILSSGQRDEVRRRIASADRLGADEAAWVEEVALASDDDAALALVARRPPDFLA